MLGMTDTRWIQVGRDRAAGTANILVALADLRHRKERYNAPSSCRFQLSGDSGQKRTELEKVVLEFPHGTYQTHGLIYLMNRVRVRLNFILRSRYSQNYEREKFRLMQCQHKLVKRAAKKIS